MSTNPDLAYTYQVGGSLPTDAPTYGTRRADTEFYESLKQGEFCYVLNSRQMGKSSLRVRTMQRLRSEGVACAAVEITRIGTKNITPDQWYAGVAYHIAKELKLDDKFDFEIENWWEEKRLLSPVQRFAEFLDAILLQYVTAPIVVFIDEIDSVLSLPFAIEDFFAVIRECYNNRADRPTDRRITFALLGVATPSDLMQDRQRTPFNIGKAIELTGLTLTEAKPLVDGLAAKIENPQAIMQAILDWTGGQPFLTQKVCTLVLREIEEQKNSAAQAGTISPPTLYSLPPTQIDTLIRTKVIDNWETQDEPVHLKTIRDRVLLSSDYKTKQLEMYQQILTQNSIVADDSPEQMEMRLTGLVVKQDTKLKVCNRIYAEVFDRSWLDKELAKLSRSPSQISDSIPISESHSPYQIGGSLPTDAPTYVIRRADRDLYEGLNAGEFCYVLNSQQMGKSSLKVRTMQRLRSEGVACAAVDITAIGTLNITPDRWYAGIIYRIVREFNLDDEFDFEIDDWWGKKRWLSPVQRFAEFLDTILLQYVTTPIVIFVDEIDSVLGLPFAIDDFFAVIRECYNYRADRPAYRRLTFALLGVATPSDLIQDKRRTPFNIGKGIELMGLTLTEAQPLAVGLAEKAANPDLVLREVLDWTGGQPFLTQKVCRLIAQSAFPIAVGSEQKIIANLVRNNIIENWEAQDDTQHLKTICSSILYSRGNKAVQLLGMYQRILADRSGIIADDSPEQIEMRLTGLVVKQNSHLLVYNRIYAEVFNYDWLQKALADLRPYAVALEAWIKSDNKDESRLLRGQALEDAREWARDKKLSYNDYLFLSESQQFEQREVEQTLESERQAREVADQSKQIAQQTQGIERRRRKLTQEAIDKAYQKVWLSSIIVVLTLAIAGIVAGVSILDAILRENDFKKKSTSLELAKERINLATKDIITAIEYAEANRGEPKEAKNHLTTAKRNLEVAKRNIESADQQTTAIQRLTTVVQELIAFILKYPTVLTSLIISILLLIRILHWFRFQKNASLPKLMTNLKNISRKLLLLLRK